MELRKQRWTRGPSGKSDILALQLPFHSLQLHVERQLNNNNNKSVDVLKLRLNQQQQQQQIRSDPIAA